MILSLAKPSGELASQASWARISSKERDASIVSRKSQIDLALFINAVLLWKNERPILSESDKNIDFLIYLILGEILEVDEHRSEVNSEEHSFESEEGEMIDVGFMLGIATGLLQDHKKYVDHHTILYSANGQSSGSDAINKMAEVAGNISASSFEKDLEHVWILWVSYLIHMEFPVDANKKLAEYTIPKNSGNYIRELLKNNPLFEVAYQRPMNKEESLAYYDHYRRATRIIRDFILEHVDPNIKDTGLKPEHYRPYEMFIYNFMSFSGTGIGPEKALSMLKDQLHKDYDIS